MALVDYTMQEHIALVTLNDGENRFNPAFLAAFMGVLDDIENHTDASTLVVHSSHEKIFSNGIDLEWLLGVLQQDDRATSKQFFYDLRLVFKRLVTFPLVTIAAVVRVAVPLVAPAIYRASLVLVTAFWLAAFGIYLYLYWPVLTRPRVDGKPG